MISRLQPECYDGLDKNLDASVRRLHCMPCMMLDFKVRNLVSDQAPVGTLISFNSSVKNMLSN